MIAALDVQYDGKRAVAAAVAFVNWSDSQAVEETSAFVDDIAPYVPGEFWKRELPCLLQVTGRLSCRPSITIIDGYVWLDAEHRPGLGAHLFQALGGHVAVVGVAKTAFRGSSHALRVQRGEGTRPLFITASGISVDEAAQAVQRMHGPFRVPTLLKRADALCRSRLAETLKDVP